MTAPTITPVSYSYETAALATGHSETTIRRAVAAGSLVARYVELDGKRSSKPVIERSELKRWVAEGAIERSTT